MDRENPKCRIEMFTSLGLYDNIRKWFFPCSNMMLLNEVSDTFSSLKQLPSEDSQSHDEEVKTWAINAKNYLSPQKEEEKDSSDSVIHATAMLPSQKKDDEALKTDINKALKELYGEDEPYFVCVKCREAGEEKGDLIHIWAVANEDIRNLEQQQLEENWHHIWNKTFTEDSSDETSNGDGGTTQNGDGSHEKPKETSPQGEPVQTKESNGDGDGTTPNGENKQKPSFWSSIKKHLFSAWTFSKKGLCIASLLYLIVTLSGYFLFFRDNSIQIALPDNLSDTKVWAYNNKGQPCEAGKKLSRDDRRYIIKCGILPAQWFAKTIRISGYEMIVLSSLKEDNGHYEVTESDLKPLTEWPVVFTNNPKLPFEINTQVQFFESELDCKNNQKYIDWRTYQSSVEPLTVQPRWAKIRSGNEDLSYCAEGKEHFDTQDFRLTFSFKSNQFEGKRKIVVIAPSVQLASDGIGRIIQDTLKKWLFELKKPHTNVPITILLIGTNEEVNTLIRSEDLNELPDEGENSITAKVNGIKFVSDSFRSVYELEQVDLALEGKDFDQVLYLTDGESYSGSSTLSSSLKKALGIPQYWMNNGVSFSVLTVGDCGFWRTEMTEAKCQTLSQYNKSRAQWLFKDMLKKLLPKY